MLSLLRNWMRISQSSRRKSRLRMDFACSRQVESLEERRLLSAAGETTVHQLFNPNANVHFYTTDGGEANILVKIGWQEQTGNDGTGLLVFSQQQPGTLPVHRLYNPNTGEHYYTESDGERSALSKAGWHAEGDQGYMYPSSGDLSSLPGDGAVVAFRMYKPDQNHSGHGDHVITTNPIEAQKLKDAGWQVNADVGMGLVDQQILANGNVAHDSSQIQTWDEAFRNDTLHSLLDQLSIPAGNMSANDATPAAMATGSDAGSTSGSSSDSNSDSPSSSPSSSDSSSTSGTSGSLSSRDQALLLLALLGGGSSSSPSYTPSSSAGSTWSTPTYPSSRSTNWDALYGSQYANDLWNSEANYYYDHYDYSGYSTFND